MSMAMVGAIMAAASMIAAMAFGAEDLAAPARTLSAQETNQLL